MILTKEEVRDTYCETFGLMKGFYISDADFAAAIERKVIEKVRATCAVAVFHERVGFKPLNGPFIEHGDTVYLLPKESND